MEPTSKVDIHSRAIRRLNLRDLRVFLAVARSGSMSRAAAELGVSQPWVSKTIKTLEEELGAELLERATRGVVLNTFGEAVVRCASIVFDEINQGVRELEFLKDASRGELRIGCLGGITQMAMFTNAVDRFRELAPEATLWIDEVPSPEALAEAVKDRRYDVGLLRTAQPYEGRELNIQTLFHDRLIFVAGPSHPLISREILSLEELVDQQWIIGSTDAGYYRSMTQLFAANGLQMPLPKVVTLSVTLRNYLLASGKFVAPFSDASLRVVNARETVLLPLNVPPSWPERPVDMLTLKGRSVALIAQRFMSCLTVAAREFKQAQSSPPTK